MLCPRSSGLASSDTRRFMDLAQRYETPNAAARWDDPLFVVFPGTTTAACSDLINIGEEPPLAAIRAALFDRQAPKPNIATVPVRTSPCSS